MTGEGSFFVDLGVLTPDEFRRMQDLQLLLEIAVLVLHGPQNRRDSLDHFCDLYSKPGPDASKRLGEAKARTYALCAQVWELFGGEKIQSRHFPGRPENDFYSLVGALQARGLLTKPQLKELGEPLVGVIGEFRRQVTLYTARVRSGEDAGEEFAPEVMRYAGTLLGAQMNSLKNRTERIAVWVQVMNDVVSTIDGAGFSPLQRRLIWAMSPDKRCGRCSEVVAWEDFHAGHLVPQAMGGKAVLSNGRVEHSDCNLKAGAN